VINSHGSTLEMIINALEKQGVEFIDDGVRPTKKRSR
jgi:hypothetical protein